MSIVQNHLDLMRELTLTKQFPLARKHSFSLRQHADSNCNYTSSSDLYLSQLINIIDSQIEALESSSDIQNFDLDNVVGNINRAEFFTKTTDNIGYL